MSFGTCALGFYIYSDEFTMPSEIAAIMLSGPWGTSGALRPSQVFHVFCDESYTNTAVQDGFRVQGALWVSAPSMSEVRAGIRILRTTCHTYGEVKWSKLRGPRIPELVAGLVDFFFTSSVAAAMRFECMVIRNDLDPTMDRNALAREVGYYKTFHLLLTHRLQGGSVNHLFLDWRASRQAEPDDTLMRCLAGSGRRSNPPFQVASCRSVRSHEEDLIQITDLFCGAVGWAWNQLRGRARSKERVHDAISQHLGWSDLHRETPPGPRRFGIWQYQPRRQVA